MTSVNEKRFDEMTPDEVRQFVAFHAGRLVGITQFTNDEPPNWPLDRESRALEQCVVSQKRPEILAGIFHLVFLKVSRPADQLMAFLGMLNGERRMPDAKMQEEKLRDRLKVALTMSDDIIDGPHKRRAMALLCYHAGILEGEMFGNHAEAAKWHQRSAANDRLAGEVGGAVISEFCAAVSGVRHAQGIGMELAESLRQLSRAYTVLQDTLRDTTDPKRQDWRDRSAPQWMAQLGATIP